MRNVEMRFEEKNRQATEANTPWTASTPNAGTHEKEERLPFASFAHE